MVSNLLLGALSRVQARRLREDEEGLSLLAYALGSAVIVAPLVIVLLPVVQDSTTAVEDAVDAAIAAS